MGTASGFAYLVDQNSAGVHYARYRADAFATNTDRLFLTLDWIC